MVDTLRKLLLAGLGALDMTEEKAKAVFADLTTRGEMSEKEAKELISSWSKRAAEQREHLQKEIEQSVHRAMNAMGIARQAEIDALKARVNDLEARLAGKDSGKSA